MGREAQSRELLDRIATAMRTGVASQRTAEMHLASFAFSEQPAGDRSGRAAVAGELPVDWRYFVLRALRTVSEPETVLLLEGVRGSGRPLDELVGLFERTSQDRLATADRVRQLAAAGLVGRDLESDRVSLTPLGTALLDLVTELELMAQGGPR